MSLTIKGWKLYNLLTSDPNKWWSCEEIHEKIPELELINDDRNPSPEITQLRITINECPEVDKIIVTKKHCFKVATLDEYRQERNAHIRRLKGLVAQIESQDRKYDRDGQGKLFSNVLTDLKDTHEQYHQTFVVKELAVIDLVKRIAYLVFCKNVKWINETTVEITFENDEIKQITDIHEVITINKLNTPFYEKYDRIVFSH